MKTQQESASLDLCLRKSRLLKSHHNRDVIELLLHENAKPTYSNFFFSKSVFEKLRFRDGLVWKVGLTVELELLFKFLSVNETEIVAIS